jgi:hypothetical protein
MKKKNIESSFDSWLREEGTLERKEQRYEAKLAALRVAIDDGDSSGVAEGSVLARVREKLNLPRPR